MGQINTREIVLYNSTGITASAVGVDINLIQGWQAAIVSVTTANASGTSPTLAMFIQKKLGQAAATDLVGNAPTGTAIYDDVMSFISITGNGTRIMQACTGELTPTANATTVTTASWAKQDAALTADSLRVGPIGGLWRVKFTIGGTSPSFDIAVVAQLIPFGT